MPESGGANFCVTKSFTKKHAKGHFAISPVKEDFLRWQTKEDQEHIFLAGQKERVTLRCHPNYKNEGPWYDWVIVRFDTSGIQFQRDTATSKRSFLRSGGKTCDWKPIQGNTQYDDGFVPCKILAIAKNPAKDKGNDIRLLVHGCQYRTNFLQTQWDTVLLEFWRLAYHDRFEDLPPQYRDIHRENFPRNKLSHQVPHLTWITIDSIFDRCLVIEEEPGIFETVPLDVKGEQRNWVMLVQSHESWPSEFTE